jgi:hypothetical protein
MSARSPRRHAASQPQRRDATLPQALQSGEADLAAGLLPGLDAGFYRQTLYAPDSICLANPQHPGITRQQPAHWNLEVYQAKAHIGIGSGTGY